MRPEVMTISCEIKHLSSCVDLIDGYKGKIRGMFGIQDSDSNKAYIVFRLPKNRKNEKNLREALRGIVSVDL